MTVTNEQRCEVIDEMRELTKGSLGFVDFANIIMDWQVKTMNDRTLELTAELAEQERNKC